MFAEAKSKLTASELKMVELLLSDSRARAVAADFLRKRLGMPARVAMMMIQTWNDPDEGGFPRSRFTRSSAPPFEAKMFLFVSSFVFLAVTVLGVVTKLAN